MMDRYGLLEEVENILHSKGLNMEQLIKMFRVIHNCSVGLDFGNLWIELLLDPPYWSPYEIRKDKTLRVTVEFYGKDGETQNIIHRDYSLKELERFFIRKKSGRRECESRRRKS